jgi:hypothetical protein
MNEYWCIPPKENAEFVACMEDILNIYQLPYNPDLPVICMDEKPYQLLGEKVEPLPVRPGDIKKTDSEYVRNGTSSIFVFTEVLAGFRHVSVREHRTRQDWAEEIRYLLTEIYPNHERIILVMDNLNTHGKASLYQTFTAAEAFELSNRLEIHYTPKHGSWLNIAEIELNAMARQCLNRRIDNLSELTTELAVWENRRNASCKTVHWQFAKDDARIKLKSLYPKFSS